MNTLSAHPKTTSDHKPAFQLPKSFRFPRLGVKTLDLWVHVLMRKRDAGIYERVDLYSSPFSIHGTTYAYRQVHTFRLGLFRFDAPSNAYPSKVAVCAAPMSTRQLSPNRFVTTPTTNS